MNDSPYRRRRPYLLLVDDDGELRESLAELFEDEGYVTALAANGGEALDLLRAPDLPDLIIVDLMMPGMNGWQLLDQLRGDPRLCAIPLLIITAGRNIGAEALAAEILFKPFHLDDFLERVGRLSGHRPTGPGITAQGAP
jgi:CheY-like chemotaxis protein